MAKSFPNTGATVIDTSADLPAASGALEGVMMFQKDTNELKICDGSSWVSVIDTDTPNGLVLINSTSFSASSGFNVDNVFSNNFTNYRIVIDATCSNSSFTTILFQFRAGGSTVSSALYFGHEMYRTNTAFNSGYLSSSTSAACGYWADVISATSMDIFRPYMSTYTTAMFDSTGYGNANNIKTSSSIYYGGTTSFDGFRIFPNTGTVTGSLRVYGYRNSI